MIGSFALSALAELFDGELMGEDLGIQGISIDTRSLKSGDLFFAIKGPRFDGHAYLAQAEKAGAVAAVTQSYVEDSALPQIVVTDSEKALGLIGAANRDRFTGTLMGVTGSCGKTSVKEMLSYIFAGQGSTMATEGNFNNAFGVPLTLFRLESSHEFAVIELGTSSPGEIDYISRMSRPNISLITNADETHLADLVNVEGVAHEKGFILDATEDQGAAVLNRDDRFFEPWSERVRKKDVRRILSFSLINSEADCYASDICSNEQGMFFNLHLAGQSAPVQLSFWGQHQVLNACCSALVAHAANLSLDIIVQGLENARPYQRRGQRFRHESGALMIDETYNANPRATLAAVDQLADCDGETIMVLGDMLDLGEVSDQRHREVGLYAREKGIHHFLSFGAGAKLASEAYGHGLHFDDKSKLAEWLQAHLSEGKTVLVKGSRGMKMLDVIRTLAGSEYKGEA